MPKLPTWQAAKMTPPGGSNPYVESARNRRLARQFPTRFQTLKTPGRP